MPLPTRPQQPGTGGSSPDSSSPGAVVGSRRREPSLSQYFESCLVWLQQLKINFLYQGRGGLRVQVSLVEHGAYV